MAGPNRAAWEGSHCEFWPQIDCKNSTSNLRPSEGSKLLLQDPEDNPNTVTAPAVEVGKGDLPLPNTHSHWRR